MSIGLFEQSGLSCHFNSSAVTIKWINNKLKKKYLGKQAAVWVSPFLPNFVFSLLALNLMTCCIWLLLQISPHVTEKSKVEATSQWCSRAPHSFDKYKFVWCAVSRCLMVKSNMMLNIWTFQKVLLCVEAWNMMEVVLTFTSWRMCLNNNTAWTHAAAVNVKCWCQAVEAKEIKNKKQPRWEKTKLLRLTYSIKPTPTSCDCSWWVQICHKKFQLRSTAHAKHRSNNGPNAVNLIQTCDVLTTTKDENKS